MTQRPTPFELGRQVVRNDDNADPQEPVAAAKNLLNSTHMTHCSTSCELNSRFFDVQILYVDPVLVVSAGDANTTAFVEMDTRSTTEAALLGARRCGSTSANRKTCQASRVHRWPYRAFSPSSTALSCIPTRPSMRKHVSDRRHTSLSLLNWIRSSSSRGSSRSPYCAAMMSHGTATTSSDDGNSSSGSSHSSSMAPREGHGTWTKAEHERFLMATSLFPRGPWRAVAEYIGTRTPRQTMTHAQKVLQRQARHKRGLRPPGRVPAPNTKRRRRTSRRRHAMAMLTPATPTTEIPIDTELELLFAPPPPVGPSLLEENLTSSLMEEFQALQMGTRHGSPPVHNDDEQDEWMTGIGTVDAWLDQFLRSVELSDADVDDDEDAA